MYVSNYRDIVTRRVRKSQPSRSQIHTDVNLSNVSLAWAQGRDEFVADKVFAPVPVMKQSDKFVTWPKAYFRRSDVRRRGPNTEAAATSYDVSTDNYFCDVWALKEGIAWQDLDNADPGYDLPGTAAEHITQQMLIRRELEFKTAFFTTSLWTGSTTGSDLTASPLWSDAASTPIEDIDDQAESIAENNGGSFMPNKLVLGSTTYKGLRNHPDLIDRVKYTQRGIITPDLMAALFDVDQVLVSRASYNTQEEAQAETADFILGQKQALLVYTPDRPSIRTPAGGYIFTWTGHVPNALGITFDRYDERKTKSDWIEAEMAFDMKLTGAGLGAFWTSAVA